MPADDSKPTAREFIAALEKVAGELHGLRDDLGRIYGRDAAGRLLAEPPQNGEAAPMPKPSWTPQNVQRVVDTIFGGTPRRRRR